MKKKKSIIIVVVCVLAAAGIAAGIYGMTRKKGSPEAVNDSTAQTVQEQTTQEVKNPHAGQAQSVISGKWESSELAQQKAVAVMYSNIKQAMPQSNISKADIVFESLVEGGITRLCCFFENQTELEKIGPVRSCRTYYLLFAKEFEANYVHFGYSEYAADYLAQPPFHALDGMAYCSFYRTADRVAPHNAYTDFSHLQAGIQSQGYSQDYKEDYNGHFQFAPEGTETTLDDGVSANVVKLDNFAYNHPWFEYNAETKEYSRFQFNAPHIDQNTGNQLTCENIILQYSNYVPYDPNGYLNVDTQSGGEGKYITRGKAIDIHWTKDSQWGITHYYDSNNQEIQLNPGKTWVEIVLNDSVGSVSLQ